MSSQEVLTKFKADDRISKAFKAMGRNGKKFGKSTEQAFKKASRQANKFSKITKGILAASAIQKSMALASQGVSTVVRSFIDFDDALFSAASKFSDVDLETKKGKQTFIELGKAARETGRLTEFTAAQAASGLNFMALAGRNAQQSMAALPGLADLATAAGVDDFARIVDIATDTMGAFGLSVKDAAQFTINLNRVSDVLAKTQATSNTTVEQLFESIGKGGVVLKNAGQSIESFAALSGIMANSTLKAGEAGTQLRNIMLRLANAPKTAQKEMKKLGISFKDSNQNFKDVIDIIAEFERATKGMGTAQRAQSLAIIFGNRAITGTTLLLEAGSKALKKYRQSLIDSGGTAKRIAAIMRLSLGNRLKALGSAATEVGFKILSAFKVNGVNSIAAMTVALRDLDVKPFIEGLKTAVQFTMDLVTATQSLFIILRPLIITIFAYKAALIATALVAGGYAKIVTIFALLRSGTLAATAAQWLFNLALTANPIGIIVVAVTALIAVIAILMTDWNAVADAFVSGGSAIMRIFSTMINAVKVLTGFGGGVLAKALGVGTDSAANSVPGAPGSGVFAPPNKREANANAQKFEGLLRFENLPEGAKFEQKSFGAPLIDVQGLGAG